MKDLALCVAVILVFFVITSRQCQVAREFYLGTPSPTPAKTEPNPTPLPVRTPQAKPKATPRPTRPEIGMDLSDFRRICGVADDINSLETADYYASSYYYKLRDDSPCRGLYTFVNSKLESISR